MSVGFEVSDVLASTAPDAGDADMVAGFSSVWDNTSLGLTSFYGYLGQAVSDSEPLQGAAVSTLRSVLTARAYAARTLAGQADAVRDALRVYSRQVEGVSVSARSIRNQVQVQVDDIRRYRGTLVVQGWQGASWTGGSSWDDVPVLSVDASTGRVDEYTERVCAHAVRSWEYAVVALRGLQRQYVLLMDDRNRDNAQFVSALSGLTIVRQVSQYGVAAVSAALGAEFSGAASDADIAGLWSLLSGTTDASGVTGFWAGLTDGQKQALIGAHPAFIGNMTGIPYTDRDTANREHLAQQLDYWQDKLKNNDGGTDFGTVETNLKALENIQKALDAYDGVVRQLISLDMSTVPPLAAVSVGNLDAATTATYLIPGMNQTTKSMDNWTKAAQDLYYEQGLVDKTGSSFAVVAWIGYETPTETTVGQGDLARAGASKLTAALVDYDAMRGSGKTLNVVGFSYGTTTAADALASDEAEGLDVDSFVMVGSAGVENSISDASQLAADKVYVGQARNVVSGEGLSGDDWAWAGRKISGRQDPMSSSFGALQIGTDGVAGVSDLKPVTEHAGVATDGGYGYFDKFTESLYNVAQATTGGQVKVPDGYDAGVLSAPIPASSAAEPGPSVAPGNGK